MKTILFFTMGYLFFLSTFWSYAQQNDFDKMKEKLPYPESECITEFSIDTQRISIGHGDNWALTWSDDDIMYAFYTDGKGFGAHGKVVSNGLVFFEGTPPDVAGKDILTVSGTIPLAKEGRGGGGENSAKACGLVMIEGIMYAWVRNINMPGTPKGTGSRLMYSEDRGLNWKYVDWHWQDIGYPTWLNAGKNYADARDKYAYFISPDGPSAYADYPGLIMGRVHKKKILDKNSYKFYRKTADNKIVWDCYENRTPVFTDKAGCFRPNLVYNPGIKKYLLTTCSPYGEWQWWANKNNANRIPHFGIFESDNPWGPWKTVFYEKDWGKPENRFHPVIPPKWIAEDGTSFYMVYSCIPTGPYEFNYQKCHIKISK